MNEFQSTPFRSPFFPEQPSRNAYRPPLAPVLPAEGRVSEAVDARLAALARRAQLGETDARNALFLALWPRCQPILGRIRRNDYWRSRAGKSWTFDDLDQEAFIIFSDLVDAWRPDEPRFAGYFFSRFPWRMRDTLRRWCGPTRLDSPLTDEPRFKASPWDAIELHSVIESLFHALPALDRTVLELRVIDDRSDAEIARAYGVCVRTARRWRKRAIERARAALDLERE